MGRGERDMKFDYGDEVVFHTKDEVGNVADKRCWVVGITPIEREEQGIVFKCPLGTVLYTVEFKDGSDALVAESDLLPAK
jgi:hypothetical protein